MPYIPPEVVAQAREMDLLTYLRTYEPQELVHFGGSTYCTREHDSLKISNGKWCWFSRGIGGYSALVHKGFSAGSYKDMTRVAWLAPHMWAELFMENKEFLLKEIDCYIEHLSEYKTAMEHDDEETLIRLLDEGKKRKEEVDG